jgi:phosphoribosylanthranilate isomerase
MIIKICGITSLEDARAAIGAGANALGFNFYPRSTRYIGIGDAAALIARLPRDTLKVGVFVDEPAARVVELVKRIGLNVAQLHGDEPAEEYPPGVRFWKAARVDEQFTIAAWESCPAEALLLDAAAKGAHGGSGETFDWSRAAGASRRVILAGGLDGGNVGEAIRQARPWGVDACSRLERAPGRKDPAKMTEFVRAALEAAKEIDTATTPGALA